MTNHLKHFFTKATTLLLITVSMAVSITSGLNIFNLKVKAAQSTVTSNVPAAQSNTQQPYLTANPQTPPNTQSTSSSSTVGPKTKNGGQIKVNKTGFKTLAGLEPTADMVLSPEDEKALIDANLGPEKIIEPAKEALEIKDVKDTNKVFGSKNNDVVNDKAFDSSKVDNTKIDTGSVAKVENISEEVLPVELKKAESEVQAKIKEDATAPIIGTIDKSQIPAGTVFTKVELDPLEQNPLVTKGEVTTITDDAKMSPNALKRKKASLASLAGDKKKSPYRFNWGSNRCEFSSSYGKFCHNFFNGVNPGGYPEGITWSDASSSNSYYMGYNWGLGNPWSGIGQDNWSLTSLGYVWLSSGQYTINTVSDDGIRAWVNNQMVIDNWNDHGQTNNYGAISINQQGWYPIQVNFYERAGGAIRTFQISKVIDNTPPQGYSNYNRIEGNRMLLGADAWDYGSGVDRVDFFALYNGGWQYGGYEYNDNRDNIYASWMGFAANTPGQWVTPAARAWDRAGNSSWLQGKAIWFPGNRDTRPPRGRIEQLRWLTDRCVRVEGRAWDESGIDHVAFWWYYNNAWQQYKTESEDGDGYFGQTMCLDDNTYNTASSQNMYLRIDARDRAGNVAITALEDNGANNGQKSILWNAPIRDDAPPDGQITAMNWNYNNNPRCVQVVANAWDTGSRQTGVNGVHFFVGYNGNGNYWHYAGTDWNNGDNIYGQTHCLPDNIPSNTPIETSIHIFDKANRYVYDGSWGNKRTTFDKNYEIKGVDQKAPIVNINDAKSLGSPTGENLILNSNVYDVGNSNQTSDASGIKEIRYAVTAYQTRSVGYNGIAGTKRIYCSMSCNTAAPIISMDCQTLEWCGTQLIDYNLDITAEDNRGNITTTTRKMTYSPPGVRAITGYSPVNTPSSDVLALLWPSLTDRGAVEGNYPSIIVALGILAADFLIVDDAKACWNNSGFEKVIPCVFTILNLVAIGSALKIFKVIKGLIVGADINKSRELFSAVKKGEDAASAWNKIGKGAFNLIGKESHWIQDHVGVADQLLKNRAINTAEKVATSFNSQKEAEDIITAFIKTSDDVDLANLARTGAKAGKVIDIPESGYGWIFDSIKNTYTQTGKMKKAYVEFKSDQAGGSYLLTIYPKI